MGVAQAVTIQRLEQRAFLTWVSIQSMPIQSPQRRCVRPMR